MGAKMAWSTRWEGELAAEDHLALSDMLAVTFGRIDPSSSQHFRHGRSWAGARPEVRLFARDGERVVAHVGVKRRFVRIHGVDQLVGDVGLVAVHPGLQRIGVGIEMLRRLDDLLRLVAVPFGLVDCREEIVAFYESGGWSRLRDTEVRCVDNADPYRTLAVDGPVLVRPITAEVQDWPVGKIIERNGFEV